MRDSAVEDERITSVGTKRIDYLVWVSLVVVQLVLIIEIRCPSFKIVVQIQHKGSNGLFEGTACKPAIVMRFKVTTRLVPTQSKALVQSDGSPSAGREIMRYTPGACARVWPVVVLNLNTVFQERANPLKQDSGNLFGTGANAVVDTDGMTVVCVCHAQRFCLVDKVLAFFSTQNIVQNESWTIVIRIEHVKARDFWRLVVVFCGAIVAILPRKGSQHVRCAFVSSHDCCLDSVQLGSWWETR